jgi:hypothetical protein
MPRACKYGGRGKAGSFTQLAKCDMNSCRKVDSMGILWVIAGFREGGQRTQISLTGTGALGFSFGMQHRSRRINNPIGPPSAHAHAVQ